MRTTTVVLWSILLALAWAPVTSGGEILVKFSEASGIAAHTWEDGDAHEAAVVHRAAGSRRAAPLAAPPPRGDPAFRAHGLHRICVVRLRDGVTAAQAIEAYQQSGMVEYAVPNHAYQVSMAPMDSLEPEQWGLAKIRAREGWATERGRRDVLVAIVDTGVDYLHPDLAANIWVNAAEDLNGNGRFDPSPASEEGDLDGIDNDGNGFVDDVIGWDFADAPELAGTGDWRDRDNDPMDEGPSSHGTHVAGIACAVADNGIGVAGVAPGCRIMALRAGFGPLGYLQEDDVSAAIVYAVQNGAAVINMSWGDVVVSPVIKDVLAYAHARGCVLVASAGNSGTDAVHYPSGYEETISVGTSTGDDQLASSSNFGPVLDVVAPGTSILSTFMGGGYGTLGGTSMAAPHVSGLAALVRSLHGEFSNEEVRAAIKAGAVDLGSQGRDDRFGSGRIDVVASLAVDRPVSVHVTVPTIDGGVSGDAAIIGSVCGLTLSQWSIEYRPSSASAWTMLTGPATHQVIDDTLGVLAVGALDDGPITLRVCAQSKDGTVVERLVPLTIDRTPPVVSAFRVTPVIEGPYRQHLLEFATDDVSTGAVLLRPAGSLAAFEPFPLEYVTTTHRWLIGPRIPGAGSWEFHIIATNTANLDARWPTEPAEATVSVDGLPMGRLSLGEVSRDLPPGYLVPQVADFDGDGVAEVVIGTTVSSSVVPGATTLGPMRIFEFDGVAGWREAPCGTMKMYPLAGGDVDRDGLVEILGTYFVESTRAFSSYLWEPRTPGGYPDRVAWADSSNLLAVGMADADGDGFGEIYSVDQSIFPHAAIVVHEAVGDDRLAVVDTLWNPGGPDADFVPRAMTAGDLDGDGRAEVVFCDSRGWFVAYHVVGQDSFEPWWRGQSALGDNGYAQAACTADLDGDGVRELLGLARLNETLNLEHNFDARRWSLTAFRLDGTTMIPYWSATLLGVITETAFNSLSAGDLDGDGDDEVLVCVYPDYYVLEGVPGADSLAVAWYAEGVSTTASAVGDFAGLGRGLVLGFQDHSRLFLGRPATDPRPPSYVHAQPVSLNEILVRWSPVPGADAYRIYRGLAPDSLTVHEATSASEYRDSTITPFVAYWYAVSTIDSSFSPSEGAASHAVSASTHEPPKLVEARFVPPYHVALLFSAALDGASAREPGNYSLGPEALAPASAVMTDQEHGVLLAFRALPPHDGEYRLAVRSVSDAGGMPVPAGTSAEVSIRRLSSFYLEAAAYEGDGWVVARFNAVPESSLSVAAFVADPALVFDGIARNPTTPREVRLHARRSWRVDGTVYALRAQGVRDEAGNPIVSGPGGSVGFSFFGEEISLCRPVPNPFRLDGSPSPVRFEGVPREARIVLYDMAGRRVAELRESAPDGVVEWNGRGLDGGGVASGVYVYRVHSTVGVKTGRIVAIR